MSPDIEAQNDELLAMSSIYEDSFFQCTSELDNSKGVPFGGELKLHIKLPKQFTIKKCMLSAVDLKIQVDFLPPLVLNFFFPRNYPSLNKPHFTLSCKWLSKYQLSELCRELDRLWEASKESVIMFTWAQFLSDETMSFLKIDNLLELPNCSTRLRTKSNSLAGSGSGCSAEAGNEVNTTSSVVHKSETRNEYKSETRTDCISDISCKSDTLDQRGIQDFSSELNLFSFLREYNEEQKHNKFNSSIYECLICFSEKSGSNCMEFYPCCHVFCKSCCKSFFEVQIADGNIKLLKCPADQCNSDASPKQVESSVSTELYKKWDTLLLSSTLSSLDDIQLCPRIHCQYPVTIEDETGHCPSCNFVFCSVCRYGYHGLEQCRFMNDDKENIVQLYQNGSANEQQRLIVKYGKKRVTSLVQEYLSSSFISENFQKCPKCKANIEKIDGCNKMSCNRCNANFCWLCKKLISFSNPYSHFSRKDTPCFNQLFQGVIEDDEEWIDDPYGNVEFDDDEYLLE